eukprot:COSAG03_NODE_3530_length_1966_cov_2.881093_5_plen_68_part_00
MTLALPVYINAARLLLRLAVTTNLRITHRLTCVSAARARRIRRRVARGACICIQAHTDANLSDTFTN